MGFYKNSVNLTSLEGFPDTVGSALYCDRNSLVSLKELKGITNIISISCNNNSNKYLSNEFELRKENPKMSEEEINITMHELTQSDYYLSTEAKDIFLF